MSSEETDRAAITETIHAAARGEERAAADLLPLLYTELRRLAGALMVGAKPGNTLQPTALVHEAYLRIIGNEDPGWNGRGHFFGAAALAMRRILVDQARRKAATKHGGDRERFDIAAFDVPVQTPSENILELDEALHLLETQDPTAARIVMLRYFTGLSVAQTAACLGCSVSTVERRWRAARAMLHGMLTASDDDPA